MWRRRLQSQLRSLAAFRSIPHSSAAGQSPYLAGVSRHFATAPAVIKSYYDKRIVGCPGGEGEDEHDVVWFWLEKGKPHECPVCTQYFALEVVGPGGPPDGHGDNEHH